MVIKKFNVNPEIYGKFILFCKANVISRSKQLEIFMKSCVGNSEVVREDYIKKLEELIILEC